MVFIMLRIIVGNCVADSLCLVENYNRYESGALPYVDIKCLFYTDLKPNEPPSFLSPQYIKIANSHALRAFWEIFKFCGNSNKKFANLALKLHFCTPNDTHFLGVHIKKDPIFGDYTEWPPFFNKILTPNAPTFVLW